MSHRRKGRVVEVESLEALDALLRAGATSMRGWRLQDLDLTGWSERLAGLDARGAVLLGCTLPLEAETTLRRQGALVFPGVPDVPFDAYRSRLYTPDELYAGLDGGYDRTYDARVYAWSTRTPAGPRDVARTLATALHDHAIHDALEEYVTGRRLVGFMGGHRYRRDAPEFHDAARLARALAARGLVVATGGGPGAMEAANLGARTGHLEAARLDEALAALAVAPEVGRVTEWARVARSVAAGVAGGGADGGADGGATETLGIPTWFYGHEPPNLFATAVAKLFGNAVREDVLLTVCTSGIVYFPGAAGTVQELFQDACENYYATPGARAPMVLFGTEHWTRRLPAWPLLRRMAEEAGFADGVHVSDEPDEIVEILTG